MDRAKAEAEIKKVFQNYRHAQPGDTALLQSLSSGKMYELFVLAKLLEDLAARGCTLRFVGTSLRFKASPGKIKTSDPHFEVGVPHSPLSTSFRIFVDIEFETFGHHMSPVSDNSRNHEIDIVVVAVSSGYPSHLDVALGIECKSGAKFSKGMLKEALGVRRELGIIDAMTLSVLSQHGAGTVHVPMDPPSEFWLAFCDPKGLNYAQSPSRFGIELKHLDP
jgi:hypothetical protein